MKDDDDDNIIRVIITAREYCSTKFHGVAVVLVVE